LSRIDFLKLVINLSSFVFLFWVVFWWFFVCIDFVTFMSVLCFIWFMIKSFWVIFGPFLCGFGFVEIMVVFVFELFLRFIDFYVFMILCVFSKNAFSSDISKNTFFHFWSFLVRVSKIVFRVFGVAFFGHFWGKIYRKIYQLLGSKKMGFGVRKVVRKR
jgi:hypothetical protein